MDLGLAILHFARDDDDDDEDVDDTAMKSEQ